MAVVNHNRTTGIFNEKITLYSYFYKQQLNEIILVDPQSIGYIQFFELDFTTEQPLNAIGAQTGNPTVPRIPELQQISVPGVGTVWAIPGSEAVKVATGVYRIEITVPDDFNTDETVKLKDQWRSIVDEDGNNMADVENIFEVSPKIYAGAEFNPINAIDLTTSVNKTSLKIGEKDWLFFQIEDVNNVLKDVDEVKLAIATSDNNILKSNIEGIYHRNLEIHHFLDTVALQSSITARYINTTDAAEYPFNASFLSDRMANLNVENAYELGWYRAANWSLTDDWEFASSLETPSDYLRVPSVTLTLPGLHDNSWVAATPIIKNNTYTVSGKIVTSDTTNHDLKISLGGDSESFVSTAIGAGSTITANLTAINSDNLVIAVTGGGSAEFGIKDIVVTNTSDKLYIAADRENQNQYTIPSTYSFDPARTATPEFLSSELTNYVSINERVKFDIKENDGDFTTFYLPSNITGLSATETAERITNHLIVFKDTLDNKDDLFYNFSNIDGYFKIKGTTGSTESLTLKNIPQEFLATDLGNDFNLNNNEVKIFNESIITGPIINSAPLKEFESFDSNYEYVTNVNEVTNSWTNAAGTAISTTDNEVVRFQFNNSTLSPNRFISVQQEDEEFAIFTLPVIPLGKTQAEKASQIGFSLRKQAEAMSNKINYTFASNLSSISLVGDNTIRKITLKDIENDAYEKLGGGFAVEEGDEEKELTHFATLTTPTIQSQTFTNGYVPSRKKSILNIKENDNAFIKYILPTVDSSDSSITFTANYLEDIREGLDINTDYKFSAISNVLNIIGTAEKTEKLTIKNERQTIFAGERLGFDFNLSEDEINIRESSVPFRVNNQDKAYSITRSLEQQRVANSISSYYFSQITGGDKVLLKGRDNTSSLFVLDASFIAPKITSSELTSLDTIGVSAIMKIKENSNAFITYTLPPEIAAATPAASKANQIVTGLETQRTAASTKTFYSFSASGSKLILEGIPGRSYSIKLDNSTISGDVAYDKLKGDFSIISGTTLTFNDNIASYIGTANFRLNGDFYESGASVLQQNTTYLPKNAAILNEPPINVNLDYKWILDTIINERRYLLETTFNFTE